ncbi:MAG TPA: hypothetical protein GXZ31_00130 [Thermoanaerobacterales bacterium]|nr:hypothetical protein [Thermoanaerobacterales bacterium]
MLEKFIKPMEPKPYPQPFDSSEYVFQVKWDGIRILAFIGNKIRLQGKKNFKDKSEKYPELTILKDLIKAEEAILDGEVVVMQEGRPSFPRVIQREFSSDKMRIRALTETMPVEYIVFDIIFLDGKNLTFLPYIKRYEILSDILTPKESIHIIENFYNGEDLFEAVKALKLEGIVAKQKESPYVFGKTNLWKKIKHRRSILCVAGGYTLKEGRPVSILLGVFKGNRLFYIGRVSAGLKEKDLIYLQNAGHPLEIDKSPFINPPQVKGENYVWLNPFLALEVEYAEWTEDMKLRAPSLKGFSLSKPEKCTI